MSTLNARHPVKMRQVMVRPAMLRLRAQARQQARLRKERWALQRKDLPVDRKISIGSEQMRILLELLERIISL